VIHRYSLIIALCAVMPVFADGVQAETPAEVSPARTMAEAGMVDIHSLVPDMAEDIKYAGSDNFTGAPVDGYRAAKCFLLKPAAEALAQVEQTLRKRHLRLKLWDCYRPTRAVAEFVRWAHDLGDQHTKAAHFPNVDKSKLLDGYIAAVSNHSGGATADLTLVRCNDDGARCQPLDMGTHFDMFDPRAHTDSTQVTATEHANRLLLREAMTAQGFENYPMEWWHYTLTMHPQPTALYNVPVQ